MTDVGPSQVAIPTPIAAISQLRPKSRPARLSLPSQPTSTTKINIARSPTTQTAIPSHQRLTRLAAMVLPAPIPRMAAGRLTSTGVASRQGPLNGQPLSM